jgi:acetate kinase
MLGLSHISNDMREIEDEILIKNNPKAIMAMDVYCYRIKKYIGSYFAALNGLDVLVFTGGIGENMSMLREQVCREMEAIGIKLNLEENSKRIDGIQVLSAEDSKVIVLKIPTNEELMIALETESLLRQEK